MTNNNNTVDNAERDFRGPVVGTPYSCSGNLGSNQRRPKLTQENYAVLGYYAASSDILYRRFGRTYRVPSSRDSFLDYWTL